MQTKQGSENQIQKQIMWSLLRFLLFLDGIRSAKRSWIVVYISHLSHYWSLFDPTLPGRFRTPLRRHDIPPDIGLTKILPKLR